MQRSSPDANTQANTTKASDTVTLEASGLQPEQAPAPAGQGLPEPDSGGARQTQRLRRAAKNRFTHECSI